MSMQAAVEVLPDGEPAESMLRRSTRIAAVSSQKSVAEDIPVKSIRSRRNSAQETTDEDVIGSSQKQTSTSKTPSRSTRSPSRQIKGGEEVNGTPLKNTRSRGSLASTEDNSAVLSPAPASIGTRRRSLRSASKSPTMDDKSLNGNTSTPQRPLRAATASPTLVGSNKSIPSKRGRKASVTEKVIPLESIEEMETKTESLDKQNIQIESKDENFMSKKKKALIGKKNNLETITEKVKIEEIGKDASCDITDESETTAQKQINKSDTSTITIASDIEESVKQSPKHNTSEIETCDKSVKPALSLINPTEMKEKLKVLPINSDVNKSPMRSINKLSDNDDSNAQNNESSVAAENTSKINKISDSMQQQNASPESIEISLSNGSDSLNKENKVLNSLESTEKRLEEEPMEVDEFPDNYDFSGKVSDDLKMNKSIQVRLSKVEVVEQLIKKNLESTNLNRTPELNKTIPPSISSENISITINLSKSSLIPTSPRRSPRLLNQVNDGKEETDTSLIESKLTKVTHSTNKTEINFGDDKKETKTSVDTEDETIIILDDNVAESIDSLHEKSTNESCEPKESKLDATQDDVIDLDADQSDTGNKTIEESPKSDGTENDLVIFESDVSRRESNKLEVSPNEDTFIKNKLEDHINDNEGRIPEENEEHKADKKNVTNLIGLPVQQQHNELFNVDNKTDSKLPENEEIHKIDNSKKPEELQTNIQLETSTISKSDSEEKAIKIVDEVNQQKSSLEQSKSPLRKTEEISQLENNSEKSDLAEQENKSDAKESQSSLKLTEEVSDLANDSGEADSSEWKKKSNLRKCRSPVKNTKDILQPEMKKSDFGDQEKKSNLTQSKSLKITEGISQLGNDLDKVSSGDEKSASRQNKSSKVTEDISDLANDFEEADSGQEKTSSPRKNKSPVKNIKDILQPEMKSDSGDQEKKSNLTQSISLKITEGISQLGNDLEKVDSGDEKSTSRQNKSSNATEDISDLANDSEEADLGQEKTSSPRKKSPVKNTKDILQPEMKKSDSGDQEKKSNLTQSKSLKITEGISQLGNDLEKVDSGDEKSTSRQNKSSKATEDISDLANDSEEADLGQEKTSSLRKNKSPVKNNKDICQPDNHSEKADLEEQDKIINTIADGKACKEKENGNSRNQDKRENVAENSTKKACSSRNPIIDKNKQVGINKYATVNDTFEISDSELDVSQIQKTDQNTSLDVKICNLIKYQLNESSSDESVVHYLDDMAEEGEEDTPSEGSNDIIDKGESVGSSNSSSSFNEFEDTYDSNDSFIDDDDYFELLSGDEYDLTMSAKTTKKAKRIIIQSSDSEVEVTKNTNAINNEAETIKSKSDLEKPESNIEEDSDLDGMSIRPYCGLSPPSAISVKDSISDSISDSDVVAVKDGSTILINDKDNLKSLEELKHDEPTINDTLGVTLPEVNSSKDCIAFTPNNSLLKDDASLLNASASRKRQSSFTIHEHVKLKDIEEGKVCDRIVKMIDVFCSNVKSDKNDTSGDISVNISVEYINSPSREPNKDELETFAKVSETPKQLDSFQKNETGENKLEIESDSQELEDDVQLMLLDFQDKTKDDVGNNSSLKKNKRKLKEITEPNDSFSLVVKSFKLEEVKAQTPVKKNKKYQSRKSVENNAEIMKSEAGDVKTVEEKASRKDKKKGDRKLIIESNLEASQDHTEIVNSDVQDLKLVEEKGFRKEEKGRVKQVIESNLQTSHDQAEILKLDVQDVISVEEKASRKDKKRARKLITESNLQASQDQADFLKLDDQDESVEEKTSRRKKKKGNSKQITESSLQASEDDAETLHRKDYEALPENLPPESDEFVASKKMEHTSRLPKKLKVTQKLSKIKTEKDLAETLSKKNYKASSLDDLVQESEEFVTSKKLKHTSLPSKKLKSGKYLTEKLNKKDYKPSLDDLIQESKTTEVASQPLKKQKFSKFETGKDIINEVKKPKSKTFATGVTQDANKVSVNRMSRDLLKNENGDSLRKVSKKRKNHNTEAFGFNVEEKSQAKESTFPSKIFSTEMQTTTKKTIKKRKVLPTTSSNQQSWNIDAMKTSLLPSKRMKSENEENQEFHMKDFKNKMLYDLSRVSRITTTNLLKKKQKVNY